MATTDELIEEYRQKRQKIMAMGSAEAIEKRHKGGQLTARERIDYFFDPGTFTEIGLFVKHRTTAFGLDKREIPADGIITGFGKVNGRYVVAMAEDFMAMAGTFGEQHGKKLSRALDFAKEKGWPFVGMNDSGGARLQEGMDTLESYGWTFKSQIQASGIVPQIALLMTSLSSAKITALWALPVLPLSRPSWVKKSASRNSLAIKPMLSNRGALTLSLMMTKTQ